MMSDFLEKQKRNFNSFTDRGSQIFTENMALKIEWETLLSVMRDLSGKTVLDLGCGMGRNSLKLARSAKEVIGIDISEKSIKRANELAKAQNVNNFIGIVSDFKETIFNDYFDYALCVNMFHHTDELDIILINLARALKPEGRLVVFENNSMNPLFIPFFIKIRQLKCHLTINYLKSNIIYLKHILRKNGFEIVEIKRYGFLPTLLYNYSLAFKRINDCINKIPIINLFAAFYIIKTKLTTRGN